MKMGFSVSSWPENWDPNKGSKYLQQAEYTDKKHEINTDNYYTKACYVM